MAERSEKTATDVHWNERARTEADSSRVNIADLPQRTLENDFIFQHLSTADRVLEVGCGNGYLTSEIRSRVASVESFDFSEAMIASAKKIYGEKNNRFFQHSVLNVGGIAAAKFDVLVCVRVLINLVGLDEQRAAVTNFARWLRPGGHVILIEGFKDGFAALNDLRKQVSLAPLQPASINFYSSLAEFAPVLRQDFDIVESWNSGMYDLMTRVGYPLLVGADKALGPSDFHEKILPLARAIRMPELAPYARLHGMYLKRR